MWWGGLGALSVGVEWGGCNVPWQVIGDFEAMLVCVRFLLILIRVRLCPTRVSDMKPGWGTVGGETPD